ncbi:MAG: helix-turn-helix transcriptional regulator [Desulfobacteraceae bacterium]|nr:helix-turn-helix transcriptional regulator [Desulfobacteraceae bacterium]
MGHSKKYFNHTEPANQFVSFCPGPAGEKSVSHREVVQRIQLRPGLWLSTMDFMPDRPLTLKYEKKQPTIDFGCILAGEMRKRPHGRSPDRMEMNNGAGTGGIAFIPEPEGALEIQADKRVMVCHAHINPRVLHSLLREELDVVPPDFKKILEGCDRKRYVSFGKTDPCVHAIARQILSEPANGIPRRMFLEGKALELISRQIARLNSMEGGHSPKTVLSPLERNRIHDARDLLIQNLEKPPTLSQLSRQVCLSINKLQSGFRDVFGMSVFAFLRDYKMQQARQLFQEGEMNVSQVAWAVGYVNVSHFSTAFKHKFNILPKHYLREMRREQRLAG